MKAIILFASVFFLSCSSKPPEKIQTDRFIESQNTADLLGEIIRITDDSRSVYPVFASGDSIIYFNRLLVSNPDDTTGRSLGELIKPYGIKISDGELYTLSSEYEYIPGTPLNSVIDSIAGENIVRQVKSPDGGVLAYETNIGGAPTSHTVYLARGDSTVQLTYGGQPCFIDRFSNNGKYLVVICGLNSTSLVIFDMNTYVGYRIPNDNNSIDYSTSFSSDDRMMVFIRSDKQYSIGSSFLGDIWLFKFHD
ncbi:MAG: hypothetical protein V3W18_05420 [candidate division Zixibacteria bacterium]